jgi:hypothetical protein
LRPTRDSSGWLRASVSRRDASLSSRA